VAGDPGGVGAGLVFGWGVVLTCDEGVGGGGGGGGT